MLDQIRARLVDRLPNGRWDGVYIAEDIDELSATAGRIRSGSAIVMPWQERATPQTLSTGGFRQKVAVQFAVGMVVRDYAGLMGEVRALQFDTLKSDIEAALAGWEPEGAIQPCELIGGESSPIDKGVSIFVQTWATARFLTGEPQ